nr:transposase domain-containing protein [Dickeya zeae]
MELSQALGIINVTSPEHARSLSDLIPIKLIHQAFTLTDTVTLRKRKLPLESMIWLVVGMSIFLRTLYEKAKWLVLPGRRERSYPRELRIKAQKYPERINILRHSRRFFICAYKALLPAAP